MRRLRACGVACYWNRVAGAANNAVTAITDRSTCRERGWAAESTWIAEGDRTSPVVEEASGADAHGSALLSSYCKEGGSLLLDMMAAAMRTCRQLRFLMFGQGQDFGEFFVAVGAEVFVQRHRSPRQKNMIVSSVQEANMGLWILLRLPRKYLRG